MAESIKAHPYLIKLAQLLVSVSVFSFLFSPSSLLAFLQYFNFYFSTFPFELFAHAIDKNCMFLLCNGLLVFVGITRSFSGSSRNDEPSKYIEERSQSQFPDAEANELMLEKEAEERTSEPDEQSTAAEQVTEIKYSAQEVQEEINLVDEEEGKGNGLSVSKKEEEPSEETGLCDAGDEEEDKGSETDEFAEEENWVLSTEELNKKFDDFIRRMKEDLRIEAQRQLVMV